MLIHPDCMETMSHYTRGREREREAGGILLGSYRGPHIEVTAITEPLPGTDAQDMSSTGEIRGIRSWRNRRGRNPVGRRLSREWHTHPEEVPTPSAVDLVTWKSLMNRSKTLAFIILGWSGNWYGIGHEGQILPAKPI